MASSSLAPRVALLIPLLYPQAFQVTLNRGLMLALLQSLCDFSASPPLVYNEVFKQHWQQRWTFLRHEMGLSIAEISACRALLFSSLATLNPRWHFLTLLQAAQADVKAKDHLTALATLSDEHFAHMYNMPKAGLVYEHKFVGESH